MGCFSPVRYSTVSVLIVSLLGVAIVAYDHNSVITSDIMKTVDQCDRQNDITIIFQNV